MPPGEADEGTRLRRDSGTPSVSFGTFDEGRRADMAARASSSHLAGDSDSDGGFEDEVAASKFEANTDAELEVEIVRLCGVRRAACCVAPRVALPPACCAAAALGVAAAAACVRAVLCRRGAAIRGDTRAARCAPKKTLFARRACVRANCAAQR
jgi:hypothetical protein